MKKFLVIFLFFFYYSFSQNLSHESQEIKPIYLGPTFGVNYNSIISNYDNISTESAFGLNAGIHFVYILGHSEKNRTSISTFVEYVKRKNTVSDFQNNLFYDLSNNYLIIKFNYDFSFPVSDNLNLIVHSGPYYSYLISTFTKSKNDFEIPDHNFTNFELGLSIGASLEKSFDTYAIGIDYNFMLGLTNAIEDKDFRNSSHNLNLIYTFYIK